MIIGDLHIEPALLRIFIPDVADRLKCIEIALELHGDEADAALPFDGDCSYN